MSSFEQCSICGIDLQDDTQFTCAFCPHKSVCDKDHFVCAGICGYSVCRDCQFPLCVDGLQLRNGRYWCYRCADLPPKPSCSFSKPRESVIECCNICEKKVLNLCRCQECLDWICKTCTFWCTTCPRDRERYNICRRCNEEDNLLERCLNIWRCFSCQKKLKRQKKRKR